MNSKCTSYYVSGRRMSVALGEGYGERLRLLGDSAGLSTSAMLAQILASACGCDVTDDIHAYLGVKAEAIGVAPYALVRLLVHDVLNGGELGKALALARKGAGM